ncbi:DUF1330 domain-containing protein [Litorimonas haliclonae]|uniref:DUF1330 domain-containing protein n=1 Tax=Litorimonas haliclonae TaxID=2081977 RepID=UPI0039EEA1FC
MAAYMFISAIIKDRDAFIQGYSKATEPLVEKFGGRYVMRGPGASLLEGDFGDGGSVAVSEWPDKQSALNFWNSSEYQDAKKLREGLADVQVLLIEAPKFTKDDL